jgi:hypothetical protein
MSWNESKQPPVGYEKYARGVKGLIEGLVGLREGDSKTIGPISPADAYGIFPKVGDNFTFFNPKSGKNITVHFVKIITNSTMPKEYVARYGKGKTTLFVLGVEIYSLGDKITMYPSWENATVVTKMNETKRWVYTTPPEDKRKNFTWITNDSVSQTKAIYWKNASSVTSMNDTTIIITLSPIIGDGMNVYDLAHGSTITYVAVNISADKILCGVYNQSTGNTSYYEINRTIIIVRNESQDITYTYPTQEIEQTLSSIKKNYDPNLAFSVNERAGKYLIYDVQIVKIYKTS